MSIGGFWEHPGAVGVWDVWIRATPLGIPPHTPGPALKGTKVTPRTPLGRTCHFVPKLVPLGAHAGFDTTYLSGTWVDTWASGHGGDRKMPRSLPPRGRQDGRGGGGGQASFTVGNRCGRAGIRRSLG